MTPAADERPRITVLTAPDAPMLPGLEPIRDEVVLVHAADKAGLAAALPTTDILIVTDFRTQVLREAWPAEHAIQWLHATSAGVDQLMFPALVASDIVITNARGLFDRGIAEYVLGAVLLFAKDTLTNVHLQREQTWKHRETRMLRDSSALIVGAGSIGREVAKLLRAVGVEVVATATRAREDADFDAVHANTDLHSLLPQADWVIITAPLTPHTRALFDHDAFKRMRGDSHLINVGRGPVVVTDALVEALRQGQIAGAALDVFEQEPLPQTSPLWGMPNVMISAHMAGDFIGWERALGAQFIDNFRRRQNGEALVNIVDKERGYAK